MSANRLAFAAALCAATLFTTFGADARPVRWARSGDALTLDPHAQNEGPTHALNHHIYEPLVIRDQKGAIVPALATSWRVLSRRPSAVVNGYPPCVVGFPTQSEGAF